MFLCREELIRVWASPTSSRGALRILPLIVSNLCLLSAHTWRTATTTFRYRIIKCLDFRWEIHVFKKFSHMRSLFHRLCYLKTTALLMDLQQMWRNTS